MNLKGIGTALAVYAANNADRLPVTDAAFDGMWMCDQPAAFLQTVVQTDMTTESDPGSLDAAAIRKWFYCPANSAQKPEALWGDANAASRTTGYVWLNDRGTSAMPSLPGLRAHAPPLEYHNRMIGTRNASDAELVADWILSDNADPRTVRWTGISAASHPGVTATSHMRGSSPQGANVLACDGHVDWRPFSADQAAAVPQAAGGMGPYFWISNP